MRQYQNGEGADFQIHKVLKIIFVGDSNVGKTSLLRRLQHNVFHEDSMRATIGVEFCKTVIRFPGNNQCIQLHLWDTAGQERYKAITKQHYRGAYAIFLVYDMNNPKSLNSIDYWLEEIKENASSDAFISLLGNKKDLISYHISDEISLKAKKIAKNNKLFYYETSCVWDKDSESGIENILLDFVYESLNSDENYQNEIKQNDEEETVVGDSDDFIEENKKDLRNFQKNWRKTSMDKLVFQAMAKKKTDLKSVQLSIDNKAQDSCLNKEKCSIC